MKYEIQSCMQIYLKILFTLKIVGFFLAFGCYEFLESSILVTDIRNCPRQCDVEREVAVPHEVGENVCFVIWEKLQYLDNNEWKKLYFKDKIFNVHKKNNSTFLQVKKLDTIF